MKNGLFDLGLSFGCMAVAWGAYTNEQVFFTFAFGWTSLVLMIMAFAKNHRNSQNQKKGANT